MTCEVVHESLYQPVRSNEARSRRSGAASGETRTSIVRRTRTGACFTQWPAYCIEKGTAGNGVRGISNRKSKDKGVPSCSDTSGRYRRLPRRCASYTHVRRTGKQR
ncbi:protein of unknown function (plasmid) [Caballeronia sp. S22]